MLLKDKVAVITGGAGQNGLGFATARMMAEHGARIVILDLAVADPQAAAARLGSQHLGLVADVTDKASLGDRGVAAGLKGAAQGSDGRPKLVIDMSSISPMATKGMAERIHALGAEHLDAPVSGGEVGAKSASLTIMVGGLAHSFERARSLFETLGKNITHVGGHGDGQTTKVANQIIVALNIEAVAEALLFASKAGANPAKVRQALMGGFAASRILEVHGERMIKRSFSPGFRIELHQKDLGLALQGAREMGLSLPHTASAAQLMQVCAAHGLAELDHSALCRSLEIMAGHEITAGDVNIS